MTELLLLILRSLFGGAGIPLTEAKDSGILNPETRSNNPESTQPAATAAAGIVPQQPAGLGAQESGLGNQDSDNWGSASAIVAAMKRFGYTVFDGPKDMNLNIVSTRGVNAKVDDYGCKLHVFWRFNKKVTHLSWKITTYPGSYYLITKLLNRAGAAILVPGQYPFYELGIHNGKYRAVVQRRGHVRVFRDGDRDREFDLDPDSIQSGMFGINIHAPITPAAGMTTYLSNLVKAASAGCQVFQRLEDFLEFRAICERAVEIWGNTLTYTLILDTDIQLADRAPLKEGPVSPVKFDTLTEDWVVPAATTGIRHHNLLNVKDGEDWMYMTGSDSRGHAVFPTYAKGLRAGIINLRSYWVRHRLRTISGILSRWAPSSDTIGSLAGAPKNSPRDYSIFVAQRTGVGYNSTLSVFDDHGKVADADQLFTLVSAMVEYENYSGLKLPRAIFNEALSLL